MPELLMNPAVQSGIIPLLVTVVVVLLFVIVFPKHKYLACLGALAGFFAAYLLTFGLPPFPPKASGQKIIYIAILGGGAGLFMDYRRGLTRGNVLIGLMVSTIGVFWIGWKKLAVALTLDHLTILLILLGCALICNTALKAVDDGQTYDFKAENSDDADSIVILIMLALAIAGNAMLGASASIAQNAGAIAAALGGMMLVNWPRRRFGINNTLRMFTIIVLVSMLAQIALFTKAILWPLLVLFPIIFTARLADRWMPFHAPRAALIRPVIIAILAGIPAFGSIYLTWITTPVTAGGY